MVKNIKKSVLNLILTNISKFNRITELSQNSEYIGRNKFEAISRRTERGVSAVIHKRQATQKSPKDILPEGLDVFGLYFHHSS